MLHSINSGKVIICKKTLVASQSTSHTYLGASENNFTPYGRSDVCDWAELHPCWVVRRAAAHTRRVAGGPGHRATTPGKQTYKEPVMIEPELASSSAKTNSGICSLGKWADTAVCLCGQSSTRLFCRRYDGFTDRERVFSIRQLRPYHVACTKARFTEVNFGHMAKLMDCIHMLDNIVALCVRPYVFVLKIKRMQTLHKLKFTKKLQHWPIEFWLL